MDAPSKIAPAQPARDRPAATLERRTTRRVGSLVLSAGLPSIWLISAATSNLPARRVSCATVVSAGLTLLAMWMSSNPATDIVRHRYAPVSQRTHCADSNQITDAEHSVESDAAVEQRTHCIVTRLLVGHRIDLQRRIDRNPGRRESLLVARVAAEDLRRVSGRIAQKGDAAPTLREQVLRDQTPALLVVTADGHARLIRHH